MVQLRLEPSGEVGIPKDCYISVRVGEVQKLSRLSGARTYKFPQANNHRFGKIEVFRRVGSASIDLNPVVEGLRDVSITCNDMGFLGLRVGIDGQEAEIDDAQQKVEEAEKAKTGATKVKAAKEYLNKHSLEVRLSEAMQAVLRERPEDPADFLANRLMAGRKSVAPGTKLPPVSGAGCASPQAPDASLRPPPPPRDTVSKQNAKLEPLAQKQQPPSPSSKPSSKFAGGAAWRDYYGENFKTVPAAGYAKVHSKFPVRRQAPKKAPKKAANLANFKEYYGENMTPSVSCFSGIYSRFAGHKAALGKAAKPGATLANFKQYYSESMKPGTGGFSGIYGRFPSHKAAVAKAAKPGATLANFKRYYGEHMKPSTGGMSGIYGCFPSHKAAVAKAAKPKASSVSPAASNMRLKPSVGTWLMPKPPAVKSVEVKTKSFAFKPSVGSWLSPRSVPAAVEPPAAPATAPAPTAFKLRPSVGTWLAKRPVDVAAAAPKPAVVAAPAPRPKLALMASAGTWLAPRPAVVQRPRVEVTRHLCGLQSAAVMSPDQRGEVERVLSKALLELTGELEGEYYPMPSSQSYPARPGGMTLEEEQFLRSSSLLFKPKSGDSSYQGVFTNSVGDVAAWVNESSHVRFLVFKAGNEGEAKLELFQNAVAAALKQDGYAFA